MKSSDSGLNGRMVLLASLFVAALTTSVLSYAEEHGMGCMHRGHEAESFGDRHGQGMMRSLNLSEEQQKTLKTQRDSQEAARHQLFEKTRHVEETLMAAANSGAKDSQLQQLANELGQLKAEVALERAKSHRAFLAVLTPEQKQKLAELKSEHQGKMKEHKDFHQDRHLEKTDS